MAISTAHTSAKAADSAE